MTVYRILIASFLFLIGYNGYAQNALDLDGTDDYVQTEYPGISGDAARTVEAWIKTTANCNPSDGGVQQIITDWGTFVTGGRFTFNVLWSNAIRIEVGGSGLSGTIPVNDGFWHHVAVVLDPAAPEPLSLYVDGVLDIEGDIVTDINTVLGTDLRVGKRVDDARHFDGSIDEVRVWNYARTQAEIIADMNNEYCTVPVGMVAYYKFNHGIAGGSNPGIVTLEDFSGAENDGTLFNFALSGLTSNWVEGVDLESIIESDIAASACTSYTVPSGDETYFATGVYMDTLTSVFGCDSVLTIDLTIGEALATLTLDACESYTVPSGDETYLVSGIYSDTLEAVDGCDSVITIDLTVHYDTEFHMEELGCDEYEAPSGAIYTESGTYTDIIPNEAGCDSIITIEVMILASTTSSIDAEACYTYESPSGDDYDESGTYTDVIPNEAGCDSIITINLIILEDTESEISITACDSYTVPSGDETYFETGTYTDIIANEAGCDSLITIELTISEVNVAVSSDDPTLTADEDGATYQWVNCDADFAEIDGATDQSFTPEENGNYAVIVTQDGCSDTSACYAIETVGLIDFQDNTEIAYYPNPTDKNLHIELGKEQQLIEVEICELNGKRVASYQFYNQSQLDLELETAPGIYLVQIKTENKQYIFRISKR